MSTIDKFKKIGIDAIVKDDALSAEFSSYYYLLYGEKICVGCRGVIRNKFDELINMNQEKLNKMSSRKFVMIADKLIDRSMAKSAPFGMYNAKNITDDDALALLKAHKGYIDYFEQFPKDWEKLAAKYVPEEAPEEATEVTEDAPEAPEATPEANPEAEAVEGETNENEELLKETTSTDYNAKDVIGFLDNLNDVEMIEKWTSKEADLEKKRKTVIKATKKRIRQLSE